MNLSTSNSNSTMSGKQFVLWLIVLLAVTIMGIYVIGEFVSLEDTVSPEEYLAKLNDNDTYGCKNLLRIEPEILLLGDSHAYTGYDCNLLAEGLGTKKIAACTIGGSFLETILFALKRCEDFGVLPKVVIYSSAPRQFWDSMGKEQLLFSQKSQINAIASSDLLFVVQNIFEYLFKKESTVYKDALKRLEVHTPQVESLDERRITAALDQKSHEMKGLKRWQRLIANAKFTPEAEALIEEIGRIVKRNDILFYVMATPESPWLEDLYPSWIRDRYHVLLNSFKPFAKGVFTYSAKDVGLGNRHFVNRSLSADYNYSKWHDPAYDGPVDLNADHMSAVGASVYTKRVILDILATLDGEELFVPKGSR